MNRDQIEESNVLPRLITRYLWLLDYFEFQQYSLDKNFTDKGPPASDRPCHVRGILQETAPLIFPASGVVLQLHHQSGILFEKVMKSSALTA
jgi:hypothetical protein